MLSEIENESIQVEDTLSQKTYPGNFLDVLNKTVLICKRCRIVSTKRSTEFRSCLLSEPTKIVTASSKTLLTSSKFPLALVFC